MTMTMTMTMTMITVKCSKEMNYCERAHTLYKI